MLFFMFCTSVPEFGEQQLTADLQRQQNEDDDDSGADDLAAVFDGEARANIVPRDGGHGGDEPHADEHLARHQGGEQAPQVGGQVDDLHAAGGMAGIQLGEPDKNEHQEGAGAGAVVPVIGADDQSACPDDGRLFFEIDLAGLVGPLPVPQGDESHNGQHHQQQVFQYHIRRVELEPGTAHGAQQRQDDGGGKQLPVHEAVFDEPGGGEHGADTRRELVGAQSVIGRQAGEGNEVSGDGDDAAAAGNGVHERGQKHAHADQQDDP